MSRIKRKMHRNFSEYQEFIVNHPNYASLPNKFSVEGKITWVRVKDRDRTRWWDALKKELKLPDRASVARTIHPAELNGMKPCQVCGEFLSIHYMYLNARTFSQLRAIMPGIGENQFQSNIEQLLKLSLDQGMTEVESMLNQIFKLLDPSKSENHLNIDIIQMNRLSPGVMSNAPDRLDGFHTYNACCRPTQDTGRHKTNLARYSQDRRAYENWAEGDWRGANRLMGVFASCEIKVKCPKCKELAKMTADHIGPISLGFCHRMRFKPLCINCNSAKNNRLNLSDVKMLISDEMNGEQVVSWHTKALWNLLKDSIQNDEDAVRVSVLLRTNMHFVLTVLAVIAENNGIEFLKTFLNPEFAKYDYDFLEFNPKTGSFKANRFEVDSINTKSNADRYIRISIESLADYRIKSNRKNNLVEDEKFHASINSISRLVKNEQYNEARRALVQLIEKNAFELAASF
jgi:Alw26I/Eco31I/Esp3I family type II restriction endonuclease